MEFALTLVATAVAALVLEPVLRKAPTAFYVAAIVIDVLFMAHVIGVIQMPRMVWLAFFTLIQRCLLPLALFTVVMFIGCLPKTSRLAVRLAPVRAELSITAWFLSLGHMAVYLESYLPRFGSGSQVSTNIILAFVVALVLFVLLMVLGITSFKMVKKHMSATTWKKVQRLSYPFFGLVYLHVLLVLLPSALRGGASACVSVAVYSIVFVGYFCARIARARLDRKPDAS